MQIILQTNSDSQRLEFRDIERMGQDYVCLLVVESHGFCASRSFYFDQYHLNTYLDNLNLMESALEGKATLRHSYEEDHVTFEVFWNGHVVVSGSLVEHGECIQQLDFCFQTDQTILKSLLGEFRGLKSTGEGKA